MSDRLRSDAGVIAKVVGTSVLVGVVGGMVWALAAPRVVALVSDPPSVDPATGAGLVDPTLEIRLLFAGEVWFGGLTAVAGILVGVLFRKLLGSRGSVAVVALAIGGFVGSLVAWRVGVWLRSGGVDQSFITVGDEVVRHLRLRSGGWLLMWPIFTLGFVLWAIVLSDPEPEETR